VSQQYLENLEHIHDCLVAQAPGLEAPGPDLEVEAQVQDLELGSFPVDPLVLPHNHLLDF